METILNSYYENNAQKLRSMVDRILFRLRFDTDKEDFYSLANEVFADALRRYDSTQAFDGFLYSCLMNRFKTEMTARNRQKRQADRYSISIDTPVGDDEDSTLGDMIPDKFNIEREIFEEGEEGYSRRVLLYLDRLSALQREVLRLTVAGYLPDEIRQELGISEKCYSDCNEAIHSYRNVEVLF